MAHDDFSSQPSCTPLLVMACILEHKIFDTCRQGTIRFTGHKTCVEIRSIQDRFILMVTEARKGFIRRATTDDNHSVLEDNTLMIESRFHEQRIARATIIDAEAYRRLRCLP